MSNQNIHSILVDFLLKCLSKLSGQLWSKHGAENTANTNPYIYNNQRMARNVPRTGNK